MHVFDEVTMLAADRNANIKLDITSDGVTILKFKAHSQPVMKITYDYPKGALRALLKQLTPVRMNVVIAEDGRVFDNEMMIAKATPTQRANMCALLNKMRELREEIVRPMPVEYVAPELASPRSSLHPRLTQGEPATSEDGTVRNDHRGLRG